MEIAEKPLLYRFFDTVEAHTVLSGDNLVAVCPACERASCWNGVGCPESDHPEAHKAKHLTVDKLRELRREPAHHWVNPKGRELWLFAGVFGVSACVLAVFGVGLWFTGKWVYSLVS